MGGSNGEFQDLTNRSVVRSTAYGMEVSTKKSKIVANSTNNNNTDISKNGWKLEGMISFKYLAATLCTDGTCSAQVHNRVSPE